MRVAVNSTSQKHILVHLHGGLVSRSAASGAADGLIKPYIDGGTYPVFFFWSSGALSVLANNLDEVAKEPVFWRLVRRLAQLLAGKLAEAKGTRGLTIKTEPMMEVPEDPQALKDWTAAVDQDATEPDDRSTRAGVAEVAFVTGALSA